MAAHLDASHRVFPPLELKLCCLQSLPRQEHPSVLHAGHMQHEKAVWGERTFSRKLMAHCVAGKGPRSIRKSDAANTMQRCVWSTPPASLTVVVVPYAHSVKDMAPPPKNHVVSARSCIPCPPSYQKSSRLRAVVSLLLIPSFGGIGHALSLAAPGSIGSAVIWSRCTSHPSRHLWACLHRLSRVPSVRIGV